MESISGVVEKQLVRTVFQPIVHLGSGEVVGFEALSRGPVATSLESPQALMAAATDAGLLAELDWLCRVQAMRTAATARLHPSVSWFINVEADGLTQDCPPSLAGDLRRARSHLRVVLEVVGREEGGNVRNLVHAAQQARSDGWGVAIVHVGTDEKSLALLPLLQPDVIKLDMKLLHKKPDVPVARVTAAAAAYVERRGAVMIAEGIESKEQAALAAVFGATYGQGYLFGRAGPLPPSVSMPRNPIPLRQVGDQVDGTPFAALAESITPRIATRELLLHIGAHLEAVAARPAGANVILASFEGRRQFPPETQRAYHRLAEANAFTVVAGVGVGATSEPRYLATTLDAGNPMAAEWSIVVLGADYSAAFVARDLGDGGPDAERRFSFVFTHQRDLVVRAALSFLGQIALG